MTIMDGRLALLAVAAPADYQGFREWHILLVQPSSEQRAAKWLKRRYIDVYLPTFTRQVCRRRGTRRPQLYAAIPGYLFVPREIVEIAGWANIHDAPDVRGFIRDSEGHPAIVSKAAIEMIRIIEAKLNLPPERKGVLFTKNQQVRFKDSLYWHWKGPIKEIVSEGRIGIEVNLFGRATLVYAPASEIEAI